MNKETFNSPIFSIKPFYLEKILSKEKEYEFRNTYPKKFTNYYWVYESSPTMALKYLMEVDYPIEYPNKIDKFTYGVDRFHSGEMHAKYAYKIKHLYKLKYPITREELISKFDMIPPQSYTYLSNYSKLQEKLRVADLIKIF